MRFTRTTLLLLASLAWLPACSGSEADDESQVTIDGTYELDIEATSAADLAFMQEDLDERVANDPSVDASWAERMISDRRAFWDGVSMKITLHADGQITGDIVMGGPPESVTGTWTLEDGAFSMDFVRESGETLSGWKGEAVGETLVVSQPEGVIGGMNYFNRVD